NVGAATEFDGKWSADFHYAHVIAIIFSEERHRAHGLGFFEGSLDRVDSKVRVNCLVGNQSNFFQLSIAELIGQVEVEPQVGWTVQRSWLDRCWPQILTQCCVDEVGGCVLLGGPMTPLLVYFSVNP